MVPFTMCGSERVKWLARLQLARYMKWNKKSVTCMYRYIITNFCYEFQLPDIRFDKRDQNRLGLFCIRLYIQLDNWNSVSVWF